jgi:electron transfer flavoprotein alpha subunit
VRPTAFEKAAAGSSSAPVEAISLDVTKSASSSFVAAHVTKSERPELTAAKGTC